jgi:hypothetical protein
MTLRELFIMLLPPARVELEEDPDRVRQDNVDAHKEAADEAKKLRRVVKGDSIYADFEAVERWIYR